ncbi:MAG: adenylate/guanylate cyclase domain-containing protein [Pseudomonadota bacterium]
MSSRGNPGARQSRRTPERQVLVLAALWTIMAWFGAFALDRLGLLEGFDYAVVDTIASLSKPAIAREDVVVVAIDPQSFQDLGLPWPWPRRFHARLLDAASDAGARGAIFDIVFDAQTPDDEGFAAAISAFGPVVLAAERSVVASPYGMVQTEARPTPLLSSAAAAVGYASLALDDDGRLRRVPPEIDSLSRSAAALFDPVAALPPGEGYLRFQPPNNPRRIPYYQALDPTAHLPEAALRDKILIIGLALPASPTGTATGDTVLLPDYVSGPVAQPGVVAQAHVLSSLMNKDNLLPAPLGLAVGLIVLALGASIGTGFFMARSIVAGVLLAICGVIMVLAAVWMARQGGWVVAPAAMVTGFSLSALGQLVTLGGAAAIARRRLAAGFARYVAPDIMRQILMDPEPPELGGEVREVSVVVTDLEGFTSLMEALTPADGADLLRDYLDCLGAVVLAHGGMIDQFIGDSVVALFNAPLEQTDHAKRALDCVVSLDAAAEAFRKDKTATGVALGMTRIGASIGMAVIGNFGSRARFHYTAMGDVVNTASRLERANKEKGTRALIDTALYVAAGAPTAFEAAGQCALKGKANLVSVYALKG